LDNNSKKKININEISIVGGGISGCLTALSAEKKNYKNIKVYEITKKIGGVLSDLNFNKEPFFNGCQYLDADSPWFKSLIKENLFKKSDFYIEDVKYGCFTDFEKKKAYTTKYPEPIFFEKYNNFKLKRKKVKNLQDRLELYPKKISKNLISWVKNFGIEPKEISAECAKNGLMLSRIYLHQHSREILKYKKENKLADALYGLPKNMLGLKNVKTAVPKKGYNYFFYKLKEILEKKKVKIHFSSSIKANYFKNSFIINNFDQYLDTKKIVWTANPTNLIKSYNNKKLDSKYIFVSVICTNLNTKIKNNFYINVYSKKLKIFRIYCYNLDNKPKLTIEGFRGVEKEIDKIHNKINDIFKRFGINLNLNKKQKYYKVIQKRFFLVTLKDKSYLDDFYKNSSKTNLVHGAWDSFLREQKLNQIEKYL